MAETTLVPILQIQDEFATCDICSEEFNHHDKAPRILPCLHSFCSQCLTSMSKTSQQVKCPNCQKLWPVKNTIETTFPLNQQLNNLVEYITMKNKIVLISELVNMPQEEFLQQKEMCKQHEYMKLELFCITCAAAVCSSCVHVSHKDHDIHNLQDVYTQKKTLVSTVLHKLQASTDMSRAHRNKLVEENITLNTMKDVQLQDIEVFSNKIIKKVKDKARQLTEEVIADVARQQADRNRQVELITLSESVMKEYALCCQQALSYARAVDFIEMSQDLEKISKTMIEEQKLVDLPIKEVRPSLKTFEQMNAVFEKTAMVFDMSQMGSCIDVVYKAEGAGPHKGKAFISVQGCNLTDHPIVFHDKDADSKVTRKMLLSFDRQPGLYLEVLLPSVEFDRPRLRWNRSTISEDDALVNKVSSAPETQHPAILTNIPGVTAKTVMSEPTCYWQTDVNVQVLESAKLNYTAAQVGICIKEHVDDAWQIANNKHAWCVNVSSCKKHNSLCLYVVSRGVYLCDSPVSYLQRNSPFNITLGFLLDTHRKSLHIIHVNANKHIHTIKNIDVSQSLMPVFAVYSSPSFTVKLRVTSATNLRLHHQLLTLLSSLVQQ